MPSDLRVWRTNPGSVFDYDPAEDNIQSRSLHMMSGELRNSKGLRHSSKEADIILVMFWINEFDSVHPLVNVICL